LGYGDPSPQFWGLPFWSLP